MGAACASAEHGRRLRATSCRRTAAALCTPSPFTTCLEAAAAAAALLLVLVVPLLLLQVVHYQSVSLTRRSPFNVGGIWYLVFCIWLLGTG
jgi:hypothetical protein